jgi:ATP-dependent DNA helicase RecG
LKSEKTNISLRSVKRIIQELKEKDIIDRVGSDRKGYWKINM